MLSADIVQESAPEDESSTYDPRNGPSGPSQPNASYSQGTTLDRWAGNLTKEQWRVHLDNRGLRSELESSWSFVRNSNLGAGRNSQAHDGSYLAFAYHVLDRAEFGHDQRCIHLRDDLADAFEWTYGMTWQAAAERAKSEVGQGGTSGDEAWHRD